MEYLCYENKTLKINGLLASQILPEIILALTFSSQSNASFLDCADDAMTYLITRKITVLHFDLCLASKYFCNVLLFKWYHCYMPFFFLSDPLLLAARSWCICSFLSTKRVDLGGRKKEKKEKTFLI